MASLAKRHYRFRYVTESGTAREFHIMAENIVDARMGFDICVGLSAKHIEGIEIEEGKKWVKARL